MICRILTTALRMMSMIVGSTSITRLHRCTTPHNTISGIGLSGAWMIVCSIPPSITRLHRWAHTLTNAIAQIRLRATSMIAGSILWLTRLHRCTTPHNTISGIGLSVVWMIVGSIPPSITRLHRWAHTLTNAIAQIRLRATSMIEVSLSLLVMSVFFSGVWTALGAISHKIHAIQTQRYLEQISQAAAKYAMDHGYLPLPTDSDTLTSDHPSDLLKTKLRGNVPWQALGLPHEPIVNGKKFTWIVSATAIQRPGWRYSPSDREVHLLPKFHASKRWVTFARPGWCGLYGNFWWPGIDNPPGADLVHYFATTDIYKYVVQPIRLSDGVCKPDNAPPQLITLTPKLPQSTTLSSGVLRDLLDVYELELEVGLYSTDTELQKHGAQYSPLSSYLGALLGSRDDDRLLRAAVLDLLGRAVWINEPVLAVACDASTPPIEGNQLSVLQDTNTVIWTRHALLAYAGYLDTPMYTHPGYRWRSVNPEDRLADQCKSIAAWCTPKPLPAAAGLYPSSPNPTSVTHGLGSTHYTTPNLQDTPIHRCLKEYVNDLLEAGAIALGVDRSVTPNAPVVLVDCYDSNDPRDYHADFLCSAYLLEWAKAILALDQIDLFRKDSKDRLVNGITPQCRQTEIMIFVEVARRIKARLSEVRTELKRQLAEINSKDKVLINPESPLHA